MNEIVINGQDYEWRQKSLQLAESRTPFTLVAFDYLENFTFCCCYIEQKYGFKYEFKGAHVHQFTPLPNFVRPTHNYPPGFIFSGNPEDHSACQPVETD
jgi:hypothetical protein